MNNWFRSWHGAPTDSKWLVIGRKAGVAPGVVAAVVWALFDHASQAEDRGTVVGFDVETYSAFSGFEEEQIQAVIDALKDKGVIGPDGGFKNWTKRQPKREDETAAERKRKQRDQEKRNENMCDDTQRHAMSRNVTQCPDREEKRREEKIYSDTNVSGEVAPQSGLAENIIVLADPRADLFGRGLKILSGLTGKPEGQLRSLIGRWLKSANDDAMKVLRLIEDAARDNRAEPVSWIEAALKKSPAQAATKPAWVEDREKMRRWL